MPLNCCVLFSVNNSCSLKSIQDTVSGENVTEVRKSLFHRKMIYIIREIHISSYIYRHVTKLEVSISINMDRTGFLQ